MLASVRFAFIQKDTVRLMGSPRKFQKHGRSGMDFSDLLPHLTTCADDIAMIRSMQTDQFNHHPGQLMLQCGAPLFGRPTMGSWLAYGLGSESQNLPGYVVLTCLAMTACVMISYARARSENLIPSCKVGFLERPERVVLVIIGALFDRMAPVLWVTAVLGTITVIHRMVFTWQEAKQLEEAQLRPAGRAATNVPR